jgi:hypothetical protein
MNDIITIAFDFFSKVTYHLSDIQRVLTGAYAVVCSPSGVLWALAGWRGKQQEDNTWGLVVGVVQCRKTDVSNAISSSLGPGPKR